MLINFENVCVFHEWWTYPLSVPADVDVFNIQTSLQTIHFEKFCSGSFFYLNNYSIHRNFIWLEKNRKIPIWKFWLDSHTHTHTHTIITWTSFHFGKRHNRFQGICSFEWRTTKTILAAQSFCSNLLAHNNQQTD